VREGVAYIAMDIKDLRTYQDPPPYARRSGGVHEQPYNRYRGIQASPEQLTLSDALRDPEIASATNRAFSPFPREESEHEHVTDDWTDEQLGLTAPDLRCEILSPPEETPQTFASENSIPFTLLSDEESGPEDASPQEVLEYRHHRQRRMRRRHHDMDDWEPTDPTWSYSRADGTVVHRNAPRARSGSPWALPTGRLEALLNRTRPLLSPSPDAPDQGATERTRAPQAAADDPNVQAARFHIKQGKSRVTVKFDPPVSARYVLLKLWAGKSNVDVQSVIVKGYAGPRFFPAMQLL
jgi:hypothetical protein